MQSIKVGILGLGTVGAGATSVLQRNACDCTSLTLTEDPFEIVNNPEIDVVVELIGGETLAKDLVLQAIENGKHVVTANKAMIALCGNEIFAAAESKGVTVSYEAAVAGGISIIKAIREGMAGNNIDTVAGIINGTGNFILTEMRDKGRTFEDVLAEAQALGYAEADPTFDVEGIDAAHKLTILASIAFGIPLQFEKVYTEGISGLSLTDVAYAEELGYRIKHLGIAKRSESGIELRVHPTLIPEKQLIANVDGVMNAVLVKGDAVGDTLHYGAGAGAEPTGSAVVADILDVVRSIDADAHCKVPHLGFQPDSIVEQKVKSVDQYESAYYLRVEANDVAGVMSKLSAVFADFDVSIEGITQKEPKTGENTVSVIFITQRTLESRIDQVIQKISTMEDIDNNIIKVRVEHFN